MTENYSDEELVALTLKNQDSFALIINRYKEKLFNYIRRITNIRDEDAEDLLQDIFLKVYLLSKAAQRLCQQYAVHFSPLICALDYLVIW